MSYHHFYIVTLTLKVDLLFKKLSLTMTFKSEGLLIFIVTIYIWLPPASYVVFLKTLVDFWDGITMHNRNSSRKSF